MINMKLSMIFLVSVIFSCLFFTVGRWVGKEEKSSEIENRKNVKIKKVIHKAKFASQDENIIDAVYEDVIDLNEYRTRSRSKDIDKIVKYEWMFSKKDNAYVKIPRDIAEIIKRMKGEF